MNKPRQDKQMGLAPAPGWTLGEAKTRLGEIVRLAMAGQPQRITVHGKDAVVIVAADAFEALRAGENSASLHELLSQSPLSRMKFEAEGIRSPVREVE
ncbi:MAG: type II toxin-antitoxin system Phd/YefM family antitoxin [Acidobacteria bacterium]|nr:type II toxin-antitoxin system Phd/YefM family antitoxin [Acidobacteriota bacterium]